MSAYVFENKYGTTTIDFSNSKAVKLLNTALLMRHYQLTYWDIPDTYLCPPIPGRADYIHYVADLLSKTNRGKIPKGDTIQVLDIGVGANCIYPIIGRSSYGWRFVGSDIDKQASEAAQQIVASNTVLKDRIVLRHQQNPKSIFKGIIQATDTFACTICNPPFHASEKEANRHSQRKWKNLGKKQNRSPKRNFGGQSKELWVAGGEKAFIQTMIQESVAFAKNSLWFTTLVSQKANLPAIYKSLEQVKPSDVQTIDMAQGQKMSRIVGWRF